MRNKIVCAKAFEGMNNKDNRVKTRNLFDLEYFLELLQLILEPRRVNSLLDLCFTNINE